MSELEVLSHSRLRAARSCKRLHHLSYDLGYRPVAEATELRFGTLFHRGLEAWWLAIQSGFAQEDWLARAMAKVEHEANLFERAKARVLLAAYHQRWKDEPFDVLAVETMFKLELRNPETSATSRTWRLSGKIDAIVRNRSTGLVYIVEHKTSGEDISPGSEYWRQLRLDGQVSVYFDGARSLGYDVAGCLYDVIGKPALRPSQVPELDENGEKIVLDAEGNRVRTKDGKRWRQTGDSAAGYVLKTREETSDEFEVRLTEAVIKEPERYLARGDVVRLESELDEARYDIWQIAKEIREGQVARRFPRNPDACRRHSRLCPYFEVCTGVASLDDPQLFTRLTSAHPELTGGSEETTPKEEAQHA